MCVSPRLGGGSSTPPRWNRTCGMGGMGIYPGNKKITFALAALCASASAFGQIIYSNVNDVYYQNFDNEAGWPTSTTPLTWTDGQTFSGWYASVYGGPAAGTYSTPATIKPAQWGYTNSTYLYIFRNPSTPTNGALGSYSLGTASGSGVYYGVQIQNSTGTTITSFNFGYTGLQLYSYSAAAIQQLTVSYSTDATAFSDGTWNEVAEMTFDTPYYSGNRPPHNSGNTNVDLLYPDNSVNLATTITGVEIAPGESVWIRWFDVSDPGADNALAIEDFYFTVSGTPVPEPAAWAALFGGTALAFAVVRRRRS